MRDIVRMDELDLDLVSALQITPRAPWSLVGEVLGVDAATAARRWERLAEAGAVWLTCFPGPRYLETLCMAFIEVNCAPGQALDVGERVSRFAGVITTEHVTGDRDLYLTVMNGDLGEFTDFLLSELQGLPGVHTTRAQVAAELYSQGGDWKLGGLDPAQRDRLSRSQPRVQQVPITSLREVDWRLARCLADSPRAAYTELAAEVGVSVSTARRRVEILLGSGIVSIRCEVSRVLAGVPTSATVWASVAPIELPEVTELIAALPETRLCTGITGGPSNLLFSVWLRKPADLQLIETWLGQRFPHLSIVDRALGLRHVKRVGRLLRHGDLAGESVPLGIWPG